MSSAFARLGHRTGRAWPVRGVRTQLTALYGGLFLLCGAGLLAVTYLLVSRATGIDAVTTTSPGRSGAGDTARTHLLDLHQLLLQSGIALAIMTVVSLALGWLVAGRVLRPVRTITAATRRISEENLHQRLALRGPRDELTELADTIDGLLERLEAAFAAQGRFVANASHELRTPLATMRAALDVAMAKPVPVPEHIVALQARLRQEFQRMERLLESLLALARSQHGRVDEQLIVALEPLVATAVSRRAGTISTMHLAVDLGRCRAARVSGNAVLLSRMVENPAPGPPRGPDWDCRSSRRSPTPTAARSTCAPATTEVCRSSWHFRPPASHGGQRREGAGRRGRPAAGRDRRRRTA